MRSRNFWLYYAIAARSFSRQQFIERFLQLEPHSLTGELKEKISKLSGKHFWRQEIQSIIDCGLMGKKELDRRSMNS